MNKKNLKEITQFSGVQIRQAFDAIVRQKMPEGTTSATEWAKDIVEKELEIHGERLRQLMTIVYGILHDLSLDSDKTEEKIKKMQQLIRVKIMQNRDTKEIFTEKIYMR